MGRLSYAARSHLPRSAFAVPGKSGQPGKYPMPDMAHARDALSRVSANGTSAEKKAVARKVKSKFPALAKRSVFVKRVLG